MLNPAAVERWLDYRALGDAVREDRAGLRDGVFGQLPDYLADVRRLVATQRRVFEAAT